MINLTSKKYKVFCAICQNPEWTLRKIATELKIQEKITEGFVLSLMQDNYLENNSEIIGPNSVFKVSENGQYFFNKFSALTIDDIRATHTWHAIGSHGSFAGQITRDKWFPMGSICKKCGLKTQEFKINPTICAASEISN